MSDCLLPREGFSASSEFQTSTPPGAGSTHLGDGGYIYCPNAKTQVECEPILGTCDSAGPIGQGSGIKVSQAQYHFDCELTCDPNNAYCLTQAASGLWPEDQWTSDPLSRMGDSGNGLDGYIYGFLDANTGNTVGTVTCKSSRVVSESICTSP